MAEIDWNFPPFTSVPGENSHAVFKYPRKGFIDCMLPTGHNAMPLPQRHPVYREVSSESQAAEGKKGLHVCFLYNAKWHFGVSVVDRFTVSVWPGKKQEARAAYF